MNLRENGKFNLFSESSSYIKFKAWATNKGAGLPDSFTSGSLKFFICSYAYRCVYISLNSFERKKIFAFIM